MLKRKIKVLKAPTWTRDNRYLKSMGRFLVEIPPIFNREGWYLTDKLCWIECQNGKAYVYGEAYYNMVIECFRAEIEFLSHKPLTEKEQECIKFLIDSNVAKKELLLLYEMDRYWKSIKENSRLKLRK